MTHTHEQQKAPPSLLRSNAHSLADAFDTGESALIAALSPDVRYNVTSGCGDVSPALHGNV